MAAPHTVSDLDDSKRAARQRAMALRAGCDPVASGAAVTDRVLAECPPPAGAVVAGFWPIGEEIDIRPLLHRLHARGHTVVLPVTPRRGNPLGFRTWRPGDALQPERFGTFRPIGEEAVPDFLLVPLLAFDRRGYRLGYGGGFYDRTLAALPRHSAQRHFAHRHFALGVAYAVQEVAAVPAGPFDMRLDAVATENGVISCKDD